MNGRSWSVGDLAEASGLTIRTLQHYDNIGVLPASGRTANGRRFYTESDLVRLEQIVFYRSLGFSLRQIREKLADSVDLPEMDRVLADQAALLYAQTESMHTSTAAIEACREVIAANKRPPWKFLAELISKLNKSDLLTWNWSFLAGEQFEALQRNYHSIEEALEFFHMWKSLYIKAAVFHETGIAPSEPLAQDLAMRWLKVVESIAGQDRQLLEAYLKVNQSRDRWPEGARTLMEAADAYIANCCEIYRKAHMANMGAGEDGR